MAGTQADFNTTREILNQAGIAILGKMVKTREEAVAIALTDAIVAALYFQVPYLTEYLPERLVEQAKELHKPLIISPRGYSPFLAQTRDYMTRNDLQTYTVPAIKPLRIAMDVWKRYPELDFRN